MDKRTLPRSVKGAKKKGWAAVYFPPNRDIPWFGFTNLVRRQSVGTTVNLYWGQGNGEILFENASDALFASLKYNGTFQ